MKTILVCLLASLGLASQSLAQTQPAPVPAPQAPPPKDGAEVYKSSVPSVVWIHTKVGTGSGALIDVERRLVLTNYHVVQDDTKAKIFFPVFRDDLPIAEKDYYRARASRLAIPGTVLHVDKPADLAVIRLDSVPKDIKGIRVASKSPGPGEIVHSIGNAGKSGALFGYVKGTVRQVYNKEWKAELSPRVVARFNAKVIETDSPTNPGDSGGPLLNSAGELVGVTQGGAINANSVSYFIDVSEVKRVLEKVGKSTKEPEKPQVARVRRNKPFSILDSGKIFTVDAVKAADVQIEKLHARGVDVLIVTYPVAPTERLAELRSGSADRRVGFFRNLVRERMERENISGLGLIICDDPKSLYLELSPELGKQLPEQFAKTLRDTLIKHLRDGKPDQGLAEILKMLDEQLPKKE